jgi:hypothetical protein
VARSIVDILSRSMRQTAAFARLMNRLHLLYEPEYLVKRRQYYARGATRDPRQKKAPKPSVEFPKYEYSIVLDESLSKEVSEHELLFEFFLKSHKEYSFQGGTTFSFKEKEAFEAFRVIIIKHRLGT